ncbi:MAG: FmdB family transcriptional regulator [Propionibacteriaceae bacterium]|jgi:putative FmdB family regulatory protein|nr:FmdB family transcriptional regulator [Propionibacteriaceae bacterium]
MPTYQYRCTECGRELEAVQKFSDPSLTECPYCSGPLRKVFNAVGVVFKGSGFYRTDSRAKTDSAAGPSKDLTKATSKDLTKTKTDSAASSSDKGSSKSGGDTSGAAKSTTTASSTGSKASSD